MAARQNLSAPENANVKMQVSPAQPCVNVVDCVYPGSNFQFS
ncbi:hypothetical protein SPONL_1298 [uncultured Candidatus Thioglobus sp.]|nr:hypothetical protein SPONL_1298 [uncultured Candidatus Thioglobus sp.]